MLLRHFTFKKSLYYLIFVSCLFGYVQATQEMEDEQRDEALQLRQKFLKLYSSLSFLNHKTIFLPAVFNNIIPLTFVF